MNKNHLNAPLNSNLTLMRGLADALDLNPFRTFNTLTAFAILSKLVKVIEPCDSHEMESINSEIYGAIVYNDRAQAEWLTNNGF